MGLSSNARLLSITARLTSNEYESQQVSNAKMRLATKSQEASDEYIAALNSTNYSFVSFDSEGNSINVPLTAAVLYQYGDSKNQYLLANAAGQALVSGEDAYNYKTSKNLEEFLAKYGVTSNYRSNRLEEFANNLNASLASNDTWQSLMEAAKESISVEEWQNAYTTSKATYEESLKNYNSLIDLRTEGNTNINTSNTTSTSTSSSTSIVRIDSNSIPEEDRTYIINNILTTESQRVINAIETYGNPRPTLSGSPDPDIVFLPYGSFYFSGTYMKTKDNTPFLPMLENLQEVINEYKNNGTLYFHTEKTTYPGSSICESMEYDKYVAGEKEGTNSYNIYEAIELICSDLNSLKNSSAIAQGSFKPNGNVSDSFTSLNIYGYNNNLNKLVNSFGTTQQDIENKRIAVINSIIASNQSTEPTEPTVTDTTEQETPEDYDIDALINKATQNLALAKQAYANTVSYDTYIESIISKTNPTEYANYLKYVEAKNNYEAELNELGITANEAKVYNDATKAQWYTNLWYRMNGESAVKNAKADNYQALEPGLLTSTSWVKDAIAHGAITIEVAAYDKDKKAVMDEAGINIANLRGITWTPKIFTNCTDITQRDDDAAIEKAEAVYKKAMAEITAKDERYQRKLSTLDTEHNAIQTEYESVKSALSKNIERSFKAFQG